MTISFCHGGAPFAGLMEMRDAIRAKTGRIVPIVRMEALAEALFKGVAALLDDIETDPELKVRLERYWKGEQPFRFPV